MTIFLPVFFGSLVLSLSLVGLSKKFSRKIGFFDHPDGRRKLQNAPISKVGGLAVALGYTVVVVVYSQFEVSSGSLLLYLTVLVPALLAAFLGLADDYKDLNPFLRLSLQAVIGMIAWLMGTRIELFQIEVFNFALFIFWFMLIINGINLLDNSDGLAATTVAVSGAAATALAILSGQGLVSLLTISLVGVSLGFLFFNWEPAKIYLGDSGAYFLGALLAISLVRLRPTELSPFQGLLVVVLLAILPIIDTFFVVIRRLANGIHPFTAGRDHLSHQLQNRGLKISYSVITLQIIPAIAFASIFLLFF